MTKPSSSDYFKDVNMDNLEKASVILTRFSFSISDAVNIFFVQILKDQSFLCAEIPNKTTLTATENV
jgi:antitoxin component of RelBE/YafQ-DinJ toxin-antitoxin module